MRITKFMAENAAEKLTKKQFIDLEESRRLLKEKLTDYCISKLPDEVKKAFNNKSIKDYMWGSSQVKLNGCGFSYDYFNLTESIPIYKNDNRIVFFENDNEFGKELFTMHENNLKENNRLRKLKTDIEIALLNMRTLKRVYIDFPEALEFLPKNETTSIVVNIQPLRAELNKTK